jgi:hypothetical protein
MVRGDSRIRPDRGDVLQQNPTAIVWRTLGLLLLAGLLVAALQAVPAAERTAVAAPTGGFPEIILQVNDTTVSPSDDRYYLSVFLTNTLQQVAGIEMTLSAGVSGLMRLPDSIRIETTIVCVDTTDCDPADTTIDTLRISAVDMTGSAIAGWEYIQARALSPYAFRIAAVADFPGGGSTPPLPVSSGVPYLLFRVVLEREAAAQVLDTLQDRTVPWLVVASQTSFSDPSGNTIGLQESTICVNPPTCDTLDTVSYFDPTVNIYVDGAVTYAPSCLRGDINQDDGISAADIILLVNYVFKGGGPPPCSGTAGDVNCSGNITAADIIYLVNYVFKLGPAPCTG